MGGLGAKFSWLRGGSLIHVTAIWPFQYIIEIIFLSL